MKRLWTPFSLKSMLGHITYFVTCFRWMVQLFASCANLSGLPFHSVSTSASSIKLMSAELWSSPFTWSYVQHLQSNPLIPYNLWVSTRKVCKAKALEGPVGSFWVVVVFLVAVFSPYWMLKQNTGFHCGQFHKKGANVNMHLSVVVV